MLKILSLLSPGQFLLLLAISLLALLSSLGLLGASAYLISKAALLPPLFALTIGITAVRAFGISRAVFRYGERYLTHQAAFNLLIALRLRLYDIACQKITRPEQKLHRGTMLQHLLKGAAALQDFFLRGLLPPLVTLLATMLLTIILWTDISAWSLLLPLTWLCHLLPAVFQPLTCQMSESRYRGVLLDFSQGQQEIITAGSSAQVCSKLDMSNNNWQNQLYKEQRLLQRINLALGLLRVACYTLLLAALLSVTSTRIDGITLAVYLLLLLTLLGEFSPLPAAARQFRQSQLAAQQFVPPASLQPANSLPASTDLLLTVDALAFNYPGYAPLFTKLSFTISPGEHTAIIGDSGCGKTTLAYLLAGLWQPTAGTISYSQKCQDSPLAALPQGCCLFAASIRENFQRLYPQIAESAIYEALTAAQLTKVIQKLPQGIDTPLGENACYLSGGERNRLQAALLLVSSAPLLLFDEPTAGLDSTTAAKLLTAIIDKSTLTGQTVIIITHDLPQLHRFSQIINLSTV